MESQKKSGRPLQLVTLNKKERRVDVNEDALGRLETRLKELGAHSVAIISVMGAFRTGKSFLLDLFLRFLKWEADFPEEAEAARNAKQPPRGNKGEEFPLPPWLTQAGAQLEGVEEDTEGFRFKGGMDACTEGIWIWSEPFMRKLDGKKTAVLLMDTQGAWDSQMTQEQSATIFGLSAVLSSKQIYNINMQIQEDKVDNLAYFMRFAQQALRKASEEMKHKGCSMKQEEIEQPFQSLDFLVRDWRHFKADWTVEQCMTQMDEHLSRHVNLQSNTEKGTAEALHAMFKRLKCFCMPHPGLAIQSEGWSGKVNDISTDFLRFAEVYVRDVFQTALIPKKILGSELSTITFPQILREFVHAFHEAAPVAMSFTKAMTNCTVLLAKEQARKSYAQKLDEEARQNPRGLDPEKFKELCQRVKDEVKAEYNSVTIFGSDGTRDDTWKSIRDDLDTLHQRYVEENLRRFETALAAFAHMTLLGALLFVLDRISDWACDWWLQTCVDLSRIMSLAYFAIFSYVAFHAYGTWNERGNYAAAMAGNELLKEMTRLTFQYGDLVQQTNFHEIVDMIKEACGMENSPSADGNGATKNKND